MNDPLFESLEALDESQFPSVTLCRLPHWSGGEPEKTIVIEDSMEPAQVVIEAFGKKIPSIIQKNEKRFESDIANAARLKEFSSEYFKSNYTYFSDPVQFMQTLVFSKTEHKAKMKEDALATIEKLNSPAVSQAAESIIEELYMNAVIDAPREAKKMGLTGSGTDCNIFIAAGEHDLQISCSDPYGALDISKFIARMNEVYEKGAGEVINLTAAGGAGLGCVILFENSYTMILGVESNVITKVTCTIPLGISSRRRAQMKKSLHWFQK